MRTLGHSDKGAAAIELVVIFPVLLLLAIGVADFGRVFITAITVANAARAGAQFGAQNSATSGDTALINQAVRDDALDVGAIVVTSQRFCQCGASSVSCTTGDCGSYGNPRVFVEVTASKTVDLVFRFPGLPQTVAVSRTATFREK